MPQITNYLLDENDCKFIKKIKVSEKEYFVKDELASNRIDKLDERVEQLESVVKILNNTVSKILEEKY